MSELDIPDLSALGISGVASGAGALGLYWVLSPSIKAIGNAFGDWTDYRVRNLLRIGDKVHSRLGGEQPETEFKIHPRAAKSIIEEASWIDDDLHQEYLTGLLVGSRSPEGTSDDGVYYTNLVAGLSSSQVRLHYAIYSAYYGSATGDLTNMVTFGESNERIRQIAVVAPTESFIAASAGEITEDRSPFSVAANGLAREGLVTEIAPPTKGAPTVAVIPSLLGAIIFHRAMSYSASGIDSLRFTREQLAANGHTFAKLQDEPLGLTGAIVTAV